MGSRRQHTKANPKALGQRRYLLWTLLAISVLAIVVPVTVMFSKKKRSAPPKSSILVPLYVYPAPGAWDPLFTASATNIPLSDDPQLTHLTESPTTLVSTSPSWSILPAGQVWVPGQTGTIRGRFQSSMHTATCGLLDMSRPTTQRETSAWFCRISALTRHGQRISQLQGWG
jgi:hypothetical protein